MFFKRLKSLSIQILKFAFGFGIFGYFVASGKVDLTKIQAVFFSSSWMILSISMGLATLVLITFRWRLLLRPQGITISFLQALKLVFIGHFFNIVIPGTVSGDVVKVYYITRQEKNKIGAGLSVLMDRLVGLFGLIIVTFIAVILNQDFIASVPQFIWVSKAVMLAFGGAMVGFSIYLFKKEFSLPSRWPAFLVHTTNVFWMYRETAIPFTQYLFFVPVGLFVMVFPIAPAGVGVGQGVFLAIFQWILHSSTTIGADIITLTQLVIICWAFVGLVVYVLDKKKASTQSSPVLDSPEEITAT